MFSRKDVRKCQAEGQTTRQRMHVTACLDNVKKVPGHARANVKMRGGHDLVGMHFYYGGNLVKKNTLHLSKYCDKKW